MANITYHGGSIAPRRSTAAARSSIWRRMFDAVWYARERQAQRDIDRLVAARDGLINDRLEREIEQRMFGNDWQSRR